MEGNSTLNPKPFVSVLLVTRNEQEYIEKALSSLINQTYPKECYEIIVVDGESTDKTLRIVNSVIKNYSSTNLSFRVINNPKHILSAGWNLGLKAAKGDYVVRIDAHAEVRANFIELNVKTILSVDDAVCVGGRLITKSLDGYDDLISNILSSPFGVGNSSFRTSNISGYADTAVYGLYKKSIFNEVGFFNENYVRNQDIELHSRIKASGGKFYFNPEIESIYYSRNTIKKMIKQAFGNGQWNMVLLKNQYSALSIRHLVPFVFVIYLIISSLLGFTHRFFWWQECAVLLLYFTLGIIAGIKKTKKAENIIQMPLLFFLLHVSYGVGYIAGIFTKEDVKNGTIPTAR